MASDVDITSSISDLQRIYSQTSKDEDKDTLYKELLVKYQEAQKKIEELEGDKAKSKLPSKDEVESMSGMLDLISKLDASTIEKLNKFSKLNERK